MVDLRIRGQFEKYEIFDSNASLPMRTAIVIVSSLRMMCKRCKFLVNLCNFCETTFLSFVVEKQRYFFIFFYIILLELKFTKYYKCFNYIR